MASFNPCNPCHVQDKNVNGTTWCSDCEEYLCAECTSYHKSLGITRTHNLIDVKGLQQLPPELYRLQCCARHKELRVEYFCSSHDSICCRACLAEGHKSCDSVVALDLVCKDSKTSMLLDSERELKHISSTLDVVKIEIETQNGSFLNQCKEARQNIAAAKAKAMEQLNKQEEKLIKELEAEKRKVISGAENTKQQTYDLGRTISDRLEQIQFVQDHGTSKQAFLLNHVLREFIQSSEHMVSEILQNSNHPKLTFEENRDAMKTVPSLGSLKVTSIPTNIQHTPLTERHAQSATQQLGHPLSTFKVASTFKTNDESYVLDMICTDDNRLLLCNHRTYNAILVYSEDGRQIQTIKMKDMPYDIAEIPGAGQYVVTLSDINSIQFINKRNLKPGKSVKVNNEDDIQGIAASEQFIYVGGYEEILKLNIKGSLLKRIHIPDWSFTFYLSIQNKTLFAAIQSRKMVTIDTDSDSIKQRYDRSVTDEPSALRKIITDKHGYVYVVGEGSGKIYRMTKDLERDMVITDNTIRDIGAICFNKDCSKLFVASDRGEKIVVLNCS